MNEKHGAENRKLRTGFAPQTVNSKPKNGSEPQTVNRKPKTGFETGFSLISAIFLLVVIAALGTFAVTLSTTQNQSQSMDIMAARGYQAALAGVEWATFNVSQQAANSPAAWTGCVTGATVAVGGNLTPFTVTVNCTAVSAVEGTTTLWVYSVSSVAKTADSPGGINYVEQVATAKLAQ